MYLNFGKIFKYEKKYDKAVIALEEAFYLACVLDKLESKIEIIACMTSCYLKQNNLQKVIVYYHKLLDIEFDLKRISNDALIQFMSSSLRIAIRQNLFTANFRLNNLKTCCYHLNDLIEIVNENLNQINIDSNKCTELSFKEYNDLLKLKFNTIIELCKLLIVEKDYFDLDKHLKTNLKFIDESEIKAAQNEMFASIKDTLSYYRIKFISYLGLCVALLNQARLSKLYTNKAQSLLNKKLKYLEYSQNPNDEQLLKQYLNLEIDCLLIASDTCAKRIEVKRFMHQYNQHESLNEYVDNVKLDENDIKNDYEERTNFAKQAYIKSKKVIDPNIRIQTSYKLALSLYENELYQSASYYFDETLSISKTLLKSTATSSVPVMITTTTASLAAAGAIGLRADTPPTVTTVTTSLNDEFISDAMPDYHLEATIYWVSCQLHMRYMRVTLNDDEKVNKIRLQEEMDQLLNKLLKSYTKLEDIIKIDKINKLKNVNYLTHITKLNHDLTNLNDDINDSWKILFDLCTDCIIYIYYKLEKYDECVYYYEKSQYLLNIDPDYFISTFNPNFDYFEQNNNRIKIAQTGTLTTTLSMTTDDNHTITADSYADAYQNQQFNVQSDLYFRNFKLNLSSFNDLKFIIDDINMPLVSYKFTFNCKYLFIFIVEPKNGIVVHERIRLKDVDEIKQILNVDTDLSKIYSNYIDLFLHELNLYRNDFVSRNLNKIENRSLPSRYQTLMNARVYNYKRDKRFLRNISLKESKEQEQQVDSQTSTSDVSSIDIDQFQIDCEESNTSESIEKSSKTSSDFINLETKKILINVLKVLFLKPIRNYLNKYFDNYETINVCLSNQYLKLLVYVFNDTYIKSFWFGETNIDDGNMLFRVPNYLCVLDSFYLLINSTIFNNKREREDDYYRMFMRSELLNGPNRAKNITINPKIIKIEKESIKPRLTSNPRLAVNLLNSNPDEPYINIDNTKYINVMERYDKSVGTLISETVTGTNVKQSNLEILNHYQLTNNCLKAYSIGCPNLSIKYNKLIVLNTSTNTFLTSGFDEMTSISKQLKCNPLYAENATKIEFLTQLTRSTIIHITTYSSNDSNSYMVFSESSNFPHLIEETDKYCTITNDDLNSIYLEKCKLIVLSCYSILNHQPRYELAKKLLKRGCRTILLILTPIPNKILSEFYKLFYNGFKKKQKLSIAYMNAISDLRKYLSDNDLNEDFDLILSSICLIGSTNIELSLNEIGDNMLQLDIDKSLESLKTTTKRNYLNYEPKANFMNISSDLEKVLLQLQLELKLLLNELINALITKSVNEYCKCRNIFFYLITLIRKSIDYSKRDFIRPEQLDKLISSNKAAINVLTCLGFSFQASSVEPASIEDNDEATAVDEDNEAKLSIKKYGYNKKNKKSTEVKNQTGYNKAFISFPNTRYLDLNLRMSHVITSINDLCFTDNSLLMSSSSEPSTSLLTFSGILTASTTTAFTFSDEQFNLSYTYAISNFHALLPIEDKKLLSCLIDILALTKFSPEILLSLTDFSVDYAINYYKKKNYEQRDNLVTRSSGRNLNASAMDNGFYATFDIGRNTPNFFSMHQEQRKYQKIDVNNKIANFLYSIGYEIVGTWLRFQDVFDNRKLLDYMLKILTSFSTDRDMSLYRELNVSVLGQRSAQTRGFPNESRLYSLNPVILPNSNVINAFFF